MTTKAKARPSSIGRGWGRDDGEVGVVKQRRGSLAPRANVLVFSGIWTACFGTLFGGILSFLTFRDIYGPPGSVAFVPFEVPSTLSTLLFSLAAKTPNKLSTEKILFFVCVFGCLDFFYLHANNPYHHFPPNQKT